MHANAIIVPEQQIDLIVPKQRIDLIVPEQQINGNIGLPQLALDDATWFKTQCVILSDFQKT